MRSIIIKVIYHDLGDGFWNHENFSKYISNIPHSLNISVERTKGTNPLIHKWYLDDYQVEVSYERPYRGKQAKIKIKLEGRPENIEALENKIKKDAGAQDECISSM